MKCKNPNCEKEIEKNFCDKSCKSKYMNSMRKRGPLSDEHKASISKANLGAKRSEETCKNISEALSGVKHSEERVKKHSERMLGNQFGKGHAG